MTRPEWRVQGTKPLMYSHPYISVYKWIRYPSLHYVCQLIRVSEICFYLQAQSCAVPFRKSDRRSTADCQTTFGACVRLQVAMYRVLAPCAGVPGVLLVWRLLQHRQPNTSRNAVRNFSVTTSALYHHHIVVRDNNKKNTQLIRRLYLS